MAKLNGSYIRICSKCEAPKPRWNFPRFGTKCKKCKNGGKYAARDMGFVYVIRASRSGLLKIGITRQSAEKRLADMQTGSPEMLELVHTIETKDPAKVERKVHKKFSRKRAHGEWFDVDTQRVISYLNKLKG